VWWGRRCIYCFLSHDIVDAFKLLTANTQENNQTLFTRYLSCLAWMRKSWLYSRGWWQCGILLGDTKGIPEDDGSVGSCLVILKVSKRMMAVWDLAWWYWKYPRGWWQCGILIGVTKGANVIIIVYCGTVCVCQAVLDTLDPRMCAYFVYSFCRLLSLTSWTLLILWMALIAFCADVP